MSTQRDETHDFLIARGEPRSEVETVYVICVAAVTALFAYLTGAAFSLGAFSVNENTAIMSALVAAAAMIAGLTIARRFPLIAEGLLAGGILALVAAIIGSLILNKNSFTFYVAAVALIATLITGYLRFSRQQS